MQVAADSFETFFDEHYESVFQTLAVALREPLVAEEATRATFARGYARWARIRHLERPGAWLHVTATRIALRRERFQPSAATAEPDTVERAIEELTPRERFALVLHHQAGLSWREIGRALRCSPEAAASTLREAHRCLGIEPDDDDIPEVELDDAD
jgi:DNA-directed RNA polymerase specialized sigma24 family protein